MAEHAHRQGWGVPQRTPAIVAVATLTLIAVLLVIAGWAYRRTIRPARLQPVHAFPAPGVETFVHDGRSDPVRNRPRPARDPATEAAKSAIVAQGLPGWPR